MYSRMAVVFLMITGISVLGAESMYRDGRPEAVKRLEAEDQGVVFRHGHGPGQCDNWRSQMPEPRLPVKAPEEFYQHTNRGRHARRPFGRGWMTVEKWNKIKDDPTQWSEYHVRKKMLEK